LSLFAFKCLTRTRKFYMHCALSSSHFLKPTMCFAYRDLTFYDLQSLCAMPRCKFYNIRWLQWPVKQM
jgi:hypothetical protein